MARKKNFDPEAILLLAVELFWQKGYANTSLNDLVEHLGINRFSLYSTFGDKKNLYHQALNYYIDHF
ncbi:TetR family transcriptional regulator, partial ['Osedax' symbiont bacterium Rs2_46_30_T18]